MRLLIRLLLAVGLVASTGALAEGATAAPTPSAYAAAGASARAPKVPPVPSAVEDAATVTAGKTKAVAVLTNDTCASVTPCAPAALTSLTVGALPAGITALADLASGTVSVTVASSHAAGLVKVPYTIKDTANQTATSDIAVSVTRASLPVAAPDRVRVKLGESATVAVLKNDTCDNGSSPCPAKAATVSVVKLPKNVTAKVSTTTGVMTVKVPGGRIRNATLTYQITDAGGTSATTVSIRVRLPHSAPGRYTPAVGARFNDPVGRRAAKRNIVHNVIRTIDSVPGYRVHSTSQCPANPALYPSEIKIVLYSMADMGFSDALVRAAHRCVSVQLLMNNHLNARTSHSWGHLLHSIGNNRHLRSFTRRCMFSCRGGAVLHSKFYLFSQAGKAHNVVMTGSSNMTTNATHVQWNDLYTIEGASSVKATLYGQFRSVFEEMVPDVRVSHPLRRFTAGPYQTTFWPDPTANAQNDPAMRDLRSITCHGATGGAGINGRTLVMINIHAWHSERGTYIAHEVRKLYNDGCYVKILYSFMGHPIFKLLTNGTGARMSARRTIFPHPGTDVAELYSHMKNMSVSGNVGGDSSAYVVWTGSNNFTNIGRHNDEVTIRIPFRSAFRAYRTHFAFITRTRSAANWAIYREPSGGGRPPAGNARSEAFNETGRPLSPHGVQPGGTTLTPSNIKAPGEIH